MNGSSCAVPGTSRVPLAPWILVSPTPPRSVNEVLERVNQKSVGRLNPLPLIIVPRVPVSPDQQLKRGNTPS